MFIVLYISASAYCAYCACLLDNDRFLYSFIKPKLQVTTCGRMSDRGLLASCFLGVINYCILCNCKILCIMLVSVVALILCHAA